LRLADLNSPATIEARRPVSAPLSGLGWIFISDCRNAAPWNVIVMAEYIARHNGLEERSVQYLLMIYGNEAGMLSASKEQAGQMMAAYAAYTEAMKKAGVYIGGNRLQPTSTATTVRAQNGKSNVLDGPYAETKEQLGGYYMIEAPDLDAALAWAARCPGATYGAIEVRPIWAM